MSNTLELPCEFSDLIDLVPEWALGTSSSLNAKRLNSSIEQLDFFYGRMLKHMDGIMKYLKDCPLQESIQRPDENLYRLARAFMEVAPAVELFRDPDVPDGFPADKFHILL